jgi:hypothetical protein
MTNNDEPFLIAKVCPFRKPAPTPASVGHDSTKLSLRVTSRPASAGSGRSSFGRSCGNSSLHFQVRCELRAKSPERVQTAPGFHFTNPQTRNVI